MKNNSAKAYPKMETDLLPGAIQAQRRKCGKPNCKCQRGELHGPYYYRVWREEGKLRRKYVPKDRVLTVLSQTQEYREFKQSVRKGNALRRKAMKLLKEYEHVWKP